MADQTAEPVLSNYAKDRTGERCEMLVAVKPVDYVNENWRWLYQCDCGGSVVAYPFDAKRRGHCGCRTPQLLSERSTTHGMYQSPEWQTWRAIKGRCECPSHTRFAQYGAAGIKVCSEWSKSFEAFYASMGPREPGMTIDRIDNSKGYEPGNCRWATRKQQQNNRRCNRTLTINGEALTVSEWSDRSGVKRETIFSRLRNGWDDESAVFSKPDPHRKRRTVCRPQ